MSRGILNMTNAGKPTTTAAHGCDGSSNMAPNTANKTSQQNIAQHLLQYSLVPCVALVKEGEACEEIDYDRRD